MDDWSTPLALRLPKSASRRLADAGIETTQQLLDYAPMRYFQWGALTDISSLTLGEQATILARVTQANLVQNRSRPGYRLIVSVTDGQQSIGCTFFAKNSYMLSRHQRLLQPGATVLFSGKVSEYQGQLQMASPDFEEIEEGSAEAVARAAGRPIPIYRSVGGLPSWKIAALIASVLPTDDDPDDAILDLSLRASQALLSHNQAIQKLHQPQTPTDWQSALRTLAWEEALVLQTALLSSRLLERVPGKLLEPDDDMVGRLRQGLPFQLTKSQNLAWSDIRGDLSAGRPMQRLLQGDVGSGKTVIALMAMLSIVGAGYQSAMLAPTEVLARQHYASLVRLVEGAGLDVEVHLLTAKRAGAERTQVLSALASGQPSIVVGTHSLLQDGVAIPNLALVVVDEQHRFGVAQREKLRQDRDLIPHLLVMTATPIPRTIAMTVFGDLDTTAMTDLPSGRKPVQTFLVDEQNETWVQRMWQRAREEIDAGGRVYVVCPRIDSTQDENGEADSLTSRGLEQGQQLPAAIDVARDLAALPALRGIGIGLAHGRRSAEENAAAFSQFSSGIAPLLVATTVVEVGVDVPEATMMVILNGTRFGLSQLHQLRGRVGRSDRESICMITYPGTLSDSSRERLEVIQGTNDGFELAEADLRLRKEGDVLGKLQSGRTSSLKFLSVRRHAPIIAAAREEAARILKADPRLDNHLGLSAAVASRAGEELVWMEHS